MLLRWFGLPLIVVSVVCSCSRPKIETAQQSPPPAETTQDVPGQALAQTPPQKPVQTARQTPAETNPDVVALPTQTQKITDDLDALLKERIIRVVAPFSKTQFYVLNGVKSGISYEVGNAF